ncbi:MAG: TlpA family protein disulfide reductase [Gammaproteobacteria bacterium]|nr:TlpA family protein disulfide reductase [Gammaproteobacteria bacterium]MCF6362204.1 TlpA family protein disulfide reductase [Gammaproteobacteria bacterium]
MRPYFPFLLAVVLLVLPLSVSAQQVAPDFTLPTLPDNGEINLSAFKGRVVYLDFWATWCPPCRKSFPWMDEMQAQYGDDGLTIVAISIDRNRQLAERFTQQMKPGFIIAHDAKGSVAKSYKVSAMPTSYLIDREGNIVSTHLGFRKSDEAKLERRIEDLLDQ